MGPVGEAEALGRRSQVGRERVAQGGPAQGEADPVALEMEARGTGPLVRGQDHADPIQVGRERVDVQQGDLDFQAFATPSGRRGVP